MPARFPATKLLALGAGASAITVGQSLLGPGVLSSLVGLGGGVVSGMFTGAVQDRLAGDGKDPESLLVNDDLARLVGEAITETLRLAARRGQPLADQAKAIQRLADNATQQWLAAASASQLDAESVTNLFVEEEALPESTGLLDIGEWRQFLGELDTAADASAGSLLLDQLAVHLHHHLAPVLRSLVQQDFTGDTTVDGRGFASLHLAMMRQLLVEVKQLAAAPKQQAADTQQVLAALQAFDANTPAAVDRIEQRELAPEERETVDSLRRELGAFRPQIEGWLQNLAMIPSPATEPAAQSSPAIGHARPAPIAESTANTPTPAGPVTKPRSTPSEPQRRRGFDRLSASAACVLLLVSAAAILSRAAPDQFEAAVRDATHRLTEVVQAPFKRDFDPQAVRACLLQRLVDRGEQRVAGLRDEKLWEAEEACRKDLFEQRLDLDRLVADIGHVYSGEGLTLYRRVVCFLVDQDFDTALERLDKDRQARWQEAEQLLAAEPVDPVRLHELARLDLLASELHRKNLDQEQAGLLVTHAAEIAPDSWAARMAYGLLEQDASSLRAALDLAENAEQRVRSLNALAASKLREARATSDEYDRQFYRDEAAELLDQALRYNPVSSGKKYRGLPPNHPAVLESLELSAALHPAPSEERESLLRLVYETELESRGPDDPRTLQSKHFLATGLRDAKKHDEAADLYCQFIDTLACNDFDVTSDCLLTLGSKERLLIYGDKLPPNREQLLKAVELYFGPNHPAVYQCLACMYDEFDLESRGATSKRLLEIASACYGPQDAKSMYWRREYADSLSGRYSKQNDEAEKLFQENLRIAEALEGQSVWSVCRAARDLADFLEELERYEEALALRFRELNEAKSMNVRLISIYDNIARLLRSMNRQDEVVTLYREAIDFAERESDVAAPCVFFKRLCEALEAVGRGHECEPLYRRVIPVARLRGGGIFVTSPVLFTFRLGLLLQKSGRIAEAEDLYCPCDGSKTLAFRRNL